MISVSPDKNDRRSHSAPLNYGRHENSYALYFIEEGWFWTRALHPPKEIVFGSDEKTKEEIRHTLERWQRISLYTYAVITKKLADLEKTVSGYIQSEAGIQPTGYLFVFRTFSEY